jgi:aryl-alcohol dehydrogenase-like predicted oxidoreductase
MGILPWSPLGHGLLSGKYQGSGKKVSGEGRLSVAGDHPAVAPLLTERNWAIAGELAKVAKEVGRSPAQVALNWVANRPAVSSVIIGATKTQQLQDNLAALDFSISAEPLKRLEEISAPEVHYPYYFFTKKEFRDMVSGNTKINRVEELQAA